MFNGHIVCLIYALKDVLWGWRSKPQNAYACSVRIWTRGIPQWMHSAAWIKHDRGRLVGRHFNECDILWWFSRRFGVMELCFFAVYYFYSYCVELMIKLFAEIKYVKINLTTTHPRINRFNAFRFHRVEYFPTYTQTHHSNQPVIYSKTQNRARVSKWSITNLFLTHRS